ncbi:hypothetical protein F2Q68_00041424 [Brassica cretica]|uniref:Uncharacterized protein n=1 Tax=Brassica cretica TaxID=69181 RepID=A0A8S9MSL4_BRACR|nr:hypothetical protein F2Q68_00041424 [Brassica cretica]
MRRMMMQHQHRLLLRLFPWNLNLDLPNRYVLGRSWQSAPSVKHIDLAADHATATHTSNNTHVAHSSGWPAIVADPDECDESVSDLLAEVEAMEQNGLPSSPTSTFHCDDDDDLMKGPEKDFFNPVLRMFLTHETCRMNVSQPSILDYVSAGKSSTGAEAQANTHFSHCGTAGPELLLFAPPAPASTSQDLTLTTTALRLGSETTVEAGLVERPPKYASGVGLEPSLRSPSSHDPARGNTERSPRGNGSQQRRSGGHSRDRQWWNNGHNNSLNNSHNNNRQWPYSSSHGYDHGSGNKEDSDKYSKRTVMVVLLVIISSTSEQLDDNRITIFTLRLLEQTQSFSFSSFILLLSSQTAGLGSLSLVISSLNWCSSLLTSHADTGGSLCGKLPLLPRFQRS